MMGAMLSGPKALDVLVSLIALLTSSMVKRSPSIFVCLLMVLNTLRLSLSMESGCGVNCLLNSFAQ